MVAEAAMCLALDREKLCTNGGVLTPATAMGNVLIDRLRRIGFEFEIIQDRT